MLVAQLISLTVLCMLCFKASGEVVCTKGFPEVIALENNTSIHLDAIPEDTEVLIPSLIMTCDGYISHVSIGYEVTNSEFNQSVYLQLWRRNDAMQPGDYSLVVEVLLPVGDPWPYSDHQSILSNYELSSRIMVQSNDIIGSGA